MISHLPARRIDEPLGSSHIPHPEPPHAYLRGQTIRPVPRLRYQRPLGPIHASHSQERAIGHSTARSCIPRPKYQLAASRPTSHTVRCQHKVARPLPVLDDQLNFYNKCITPNSSCVVLAVIFRNTLNHMKSQMTKESRNSIFCALSHFVCT